MKLKPSSSVNDNGNVRFSSFIKNNPESKYDKLCNRGGNESKNCCLNADEKHIFMSVCGKTKSGLKALFLLAFNRKVVNCLGKEFE